MSLVPNKMVPVGAKLGCEKSDHANHNNPANGLAYSSMTPILYQFLGRREHLIYRAFEHCKMVERTQGLSGPSGLSGEGVGQPVCVQICGKKGGHGLFSLF